MAKKALGPLILIFVVFFLLTRPQNAAGAVESVGELLGAALSQISKFLTALVS